jgi:hypothetical protein
LNAVKLVLLVLNSGFLDKPAKSFRHCHFKSNLEVEK